MKYDMKIIRSRRKSIALEIDRNLQVLVRAPYQMPIEEIRRFVAEKESWIEKHLQEMQMRKQEYERTAGTEKLSMEEIRQLAEEALKVIPVRVAYYAPLVGVTYGRITIRNQRSRWGSCSGKGNLNFNCLLMKVPPEVLDYVVVHELCHRKEMNHSAGFWAEVERVLPDYKKQRRWLKEHGNSIIESMG